MLLSVREVQRVVTGFATIVTKDLATALATYATAIPPHLRCFQAMVSLSLRVIFQDPSGALWHFGLLLLPFVACLQVL